MSRLVQASDDRDQHRTVNRSGEQILFGGLERRSHSGGTIVTQQLTERHGTDNRVFMITKKGPSTIISHPMKESIADRPKTGFGVPIREWLMSSVGGAERGLRGWAREVYTRWCTAHNCPMIIDVAKA